MRLQLTRVVAVLALIAAPAETFADSPWQVSADTLLYTDDDNVDVVSPQVAAHRELDEHGGTATARVVIDYISAASVDVVSQASTRFEEIRSEVDASASLYMFGMLPSLGFRYSHEPDYESYGGRVGAERRIGSADTTLAAGYGLTIDSIGMSGTPRSVFGERLTIHSGDVGVTQVLGRRTLVRLLYSFTAQTGYMEKPYRFVPLFDEAGLAAAAAAGVELGLSTFDAYRLPTKPTESVPDERYRHAVGVRLMHYVPALASSLRLDYQLYADSWGVVAHTAEPALYVQLARAWRASLFGRYYQQSGASFWRRTYVVPAEGIVPRWRTVDRHVSPFSTATGGARAEWEHGSFASYLEGNAMWTRFDDYLLLDTRLAISVLAGVRWTP